MERKLIVTKDGSHSIEVPDLKVTYHSVHGAIQESLHVFIEAGLTGWFGKNSALPECVIVEMGFGTGLNALLTLIQAEQEQQKIYYETIEAFPLEANLVNGLNYCAELQRTDLQPVFDALHRCEWNTPHALTPFFTFKKVNTSLHRFSTDFPVHIIYFDAFAPDVQPELWAEAVFQQLHHLLAPGGILVTYCSKGDVRRAMIASGFLVEKLPGPPGKREMIRATKRYEKE